MALLCRALRAGSFALVLLGIGSVLPEQAVLPVPVLCESALSHRLRDSSWVALRPGVLLALLSANGTVSAPVQELIGQWLAEWMFMEGRHSRCRQLLVKAANCDPDLYQL